MLGWCSQLEWRAAEVCLAGLGSPSQLAAQDTKPALGKAVMPHTWPPLDVRYSDPSCYSV